MNIYTCLYYWLVEPIIDKFLDTSESQPVFEIPIESNWDTYKFALFVSDQAKPEYARVTIPGLHEEEIPNELLPLIQSVKEHFISILRITYHPDATLFPLPIWTFIKDTSTYTMGLDIQQLGNLNFDTERTKRLFIGGFDFREEVRLFIDGHDDRIPLQYRYLSLFKLLELHYKKHGQWQREDLETHLNKHTSSFVKKGFHKAPANLIHDLRDKCAHIKTGRSKEVFGVTHLNHKEAARVSKILPIMSDICVEILNELTKGNFVIKKRHLTINSNNPIAKKTL